MPSSTLALALSLATAAPAAPTEDDPRAPDPNWRDDAPTAPEDAPQWKIVAPVEHATDHPEGGPGATTPAPALDPVLDADDVPQPERKKKFPDVDVAARVMGGWEYEIQRRAIDQLDDVQHPDEREDDHKFFLQQARVNVRVDYRDRLKGKISADFADAFDAPYRASEIPFLRDAWGDVRVHDLFRIRAGHFKRPFSRLELRGISRIPFRGRGLFNSDAIEDRSWGDRGVGAKLWGRHKPSGVRWHLSATAPHVPLNPVMNVEGIVKGVDVHARLRYDPLRWLSIGANGGYKRIAGKQDRWGEVDAWAGGGDLRFKHRGFYFTGEVSAAQDWLVAGDYPWMLSALGYANYDFALPKQLVLQPIVLGEWTDADLDVKQSEAFRGIFGLNLLWDEHLRVMPQVELVRAFDDQPEDMNENPFVSSETYYLMLSFQM